LYGLTNDWTGPKDADLQAKAPWNNPQLFDALIADRKSLYLNDWMISAAIMAIIAGLIWFYQKGKANLVLAVSVLSVVMIGDMWRVSKRYLNDDSFVAEKQYENQFAPTAADKVILADNDPHYRVINLTKNPWTDGGTCYHHENIGGHHAAKIQRYQDMIENQLGTQLRLINGAILQDQSGLSMNPQVSSQMTVYNMLNTKYYLVQNNAQGVVQNPTACGNAWFVSNINKVSTNDEEMSALSGINPLETAIVHSEFEADLYNYDFGKSGNASISLTSFKPNDLVYESNNDAPGLCVFSEVIYTNGWRAFVDGEETPIYRVNYLLRSIKIPAGKHKIEMKFEPSSYPLGESISLAGSAFFVLFAGGLIFFLYKRSRGQITDSDVA